MRRTKGLSNTTLLKKTKKRTKERERVLLCVPNREIVISKVLFF